MSSAKFKLARYKPDPYDDHIDDQHLDTTPNEVRTQFGLAPDEYPGDCLKVTPKQHDWLKSLGAAIEDDATEYFVEIFQP